MPHRSYSPRGRVLADRPVKRQARRKPVTTSSMGPQGKGRAKAKKAGKFRAL